MLQADGFEKALIGTGRRCGQPDIKVYSIPRALAILMGDQELSYDEAVEHLEYNVIGSWVGEETPIWVDDQEVSYLTK